MNSDPGWFGSGSAPLYKYFIHLPTDGSTSAALIVSPQNSFLPCKKEIFIVSVVGPLTHHSEFCGALYTTFREANAIGRHFPLTDHVLYYRRVKSQWKSWCILYSRRGTDTEEKAKVVAAAWGTELIKFLAALPILHQADFKKRITRDGYLVEWMLWKNGWSPTSVHTTPNHQPPKMDALPKTFLQIILAAKRSVRHSSIRPPTSTDDLLPSLLYLSFF